MVSYVKIFQTAGTPIFETLKNRKMKEELASLPLFDLEKFKLKKTSDTLYILGSAPSLLDLSGEEWARIRNGDSLGLNRFCFHEHVPTFYWLELPNNTVACHFLFKEINEKYVAHCPLFVLNYRNFRETPIEFSRLPENLASRSFFILPPKTPRTIGKASNRLKKFKSQLKNSKVTAYSFVHSRGSLFACSQIAAAMGYKKIVYVGVDLTSQDYFFSSILSENAASHKKYMDLQENYEGRQSTVDPTHRTVRADLDRTGPRITDLIRLFNDVVCKPLGISLFVAAKTSKLSDILSTYDWRS